MRISDWSSDVCSSDLLVTTWPDGSTTRYGSPTPGRASVAITIASPTAARRIATNPMLAAGEEFMSGGLRVPDDDILPLLDLVSHNMRWEWGNRARMLLSSGQRWLSGLTQLNDAVRSKKNVAHHYDLSDRLYDLFLDEIGRASWRERVCKDVLI